MGSARTAPSVARLMTATGLVLGATVAGAATSESLASATPAPSGDCPHGTVDVASGVCQITFDHSGSWRAPAGVTKLTILAVGGGGGGGGGTTYGPGGGGGGGGVQICTTSLVDATGPLAITVGGGGTGGANGANHPDVNDTSNYDEFGDPGQSGDETTVSQGKTLCGADGGAGGLPGYNYLTSQEVVGVLDTARPHGVEAATYGVGGASGNNLSGGPSPSFTVGGCGEGSNYEYNLAASGGGGAGAIGAGSSQGASGAGGSGLTPVSGLFATNSMTYGGGGGGGGGFDCSTTDYPAIGGSGGGGNGGGPLLGTTDAHAARAHTRRGHVTITESTATSGTVNTGGGGGGGGGIYEAAGTAGAHGGNGVVVVRFRAPGTLTSAVYFATASSTLTSAGKSTLSTYASGVIDDNKTVVTIKGYTDPRGSVPYNKALSSSRAASVAAFLGAYFAAHHFSATITARGEGEKSTYKNFALDRVATISASSPPTA